MLGIEFLDKKHVIASQGMNGIIKDTYEDDFEAVLNTSECTCRIIIHEDCKNYLDIVKEVYKQQETNEDYKFLVDLKQANVEQKSEIIKYALTYKDLKDPLMLLNILNLIKVYNMLDDTYFNYPDIYVNSVEELLDLKLNISKDLKDFSRQLSVYFLSLIKSYNKTTFTPADEHIELPPIFASLILATDLLTLSGIFAKVNNINTDELTYIDNAYIFMSSLVSKGADSAFLINEFLEKTVEGM